MRWGRLLTILDGALRSPMHARAAVAALALLPAACTFTVHNFKPPTFTRAENIALSRNTEVAAVHSTEVFHAPGLTVSGSANYLPGTTTSTNHYHHVRALTVHEGDSRLALDFWAQRDACRPDTAAVDALSAAIQRTLRRVGDMGLDADVSAYLVSVNTGIARQDVTIRLGRTMRLKFWFRCPADGDGDLAATVAAMTIVHELTHAYLQYRHQRDGRRGGPEAEYVASGASACLYLDLDGAVAQALRDKLDAQFYFDNIFDTPPGREPGASKARCDAWVKRIAALHP